MQHAMPPSSIKISSHNKSERALRRQWGHKAVRSTRLALPGSAAVPAPSLAPPATAGTSGASVPGLPPHARRARSGAAAAADGRRGSNAHVSSAPVAGGSGTGIAGSPNSGTATADGSPRSGAAAAADGHRAYAAHASSTHATDGSGDGTAPGGVGTGGIAFGSNAHVDGGSTRVSAAQVADSSALGTGGGGGNMCGGGGIAGGGGVASGSGRACDSRDGGGVTDGGACVSGQKEGDEKEENVWAAGGLTGAAAQTGSHKSPGGGAGGQGKSAGSREMPDGAGGARGASASQRSARDFGVLARARPTSRAGRLAWAKRQRQAGSRAPPEEGGLDGDGAPVDLDLDDSGCGGERGARQSGTTRVRAGPMPQAGQLERADRQPQVGSRDAPGEVGAGEDAQGGGGASGSQHGARTQGALARARPASHAGRLAWADRQPQGAGHAAAGAGGACESIAAADFSGGGGCGNGGGDGGGMRGMSTPARARLTMQAQAGSCDTPGQGRAGGDSKPAGLIIGGGGGARGSGVLAMSRPTSRKGRLEWAAARRRAALGRGGPVGGKASRPRVPVPRGAEPAQLEHARGPTRARAGAAPCTMLDAGGIASDGGGSGSSDGRGGGGGRAVRRTIGGKASGRNGAAPNQAVCATPAAAQVCLPRPLVSGTAAVATGRLLTCCLTDPRTSVPAFINLGGRLGGTCCRAQHPVLQTPHPPSKG